MTELERARVITKYPQRKDWQILCLPGNADENELLVFRKFLKVFRFQYFAIRNINRPRDTAALLPRWVRSHIHYQKVGLFRLYPGIQVVRRHLPVTFCRT